MSNIPDGVIYGIFWLAMLLLAAGTLLAIAGFMICDFAGWGWC